MTDERAEIVGDGQARCDACYAGVGVWRYALPENLTLVQVQDAKTGNRYSPMKSAGAFLLCEECRGIVDRGVVRHDLIPEHFGRRMMNRQPVTRTLDAMRRGFVRKALVSLFRRVLPHLVGQTPTRYVLGSDPLQGKAVVLPGPCLPDGAAPETLPPPTVN